MKKENRFGWKQFHKWFHNQNLQTTIVLPFTVAGLCVILVMAAALYLRFGNTAKDMVEENNAQIMDQTNQALNLHLKQMMKVSDTIYYEVLKQRDVTEDPITTGLNLLYSANQDKIVSIALFDQDGKVVNAVPVSTVKKTIQTKTEEWYENAANKIEELHFSTAHVQNIFETADTTYHWVVSLSRYVEFTRGVCLCLGTYLCTIHDDA